MIYVIIALVFCVLRVLGMDSLTYQALAHVYVGGMFGAYFAGKKKLFLFIGIAMTLLEIAAGIYFFSQK